MERSRKPFNELIGIPIAVVPINTSYDQQSSVAPSVQDLWREGTNRVLLRGSSIGIAAAGA